MIENIERQLTQLVATDRIDRPISSMSGKLKRAKPKIARAFAEDMSGSSYSTGRVYARIESVDKMKARGMREGIEAFSAAHPRYGTILNGYIEEERARSETHLVFGMTEGSRLTSGDYMDVMESLGFSQAAAENMYQNLMDASRKIARKRNEPERSVLIG